MAQMQSQTGPEYVDLSHRVRLGEEDAVFDLPSGSRYGELRIGFLNGRSPSRPDAIGCTSRPSPAPTQLRLAP